MLKTIRNKKQQNNSKQNVNKYNTQLPDSTTPSALTLESNSWDTNDTNTTFPTNSPTIADNDSNDTKRDVKPIVNYNNEMTSDLKNLQTISITLMSSTISGERALSIIPVHRPLMDYKNQLNELEGYRLSELLTATTVFTETCLGHTHNELGVNDRELLIAPRFERQVRNMIQMCKGLTHFQSGAKLIGST
jgi:hypothetical protein